MEPASFILIVQGIHAVIRAAPEIKEIIIKVKDFIGTMFAHGLISKAQQDALYNHVDGVVAAFVAGNPPPEFLVEDDPI